MNAWDVLRRCARDRRSGAAEIAERAARALTELETRADVLKAARRLLRAHPAMAPLWRALAVAYSGGDVESFADQIGAEHEAVARAAAGWAIPRRATVLTHSSSSTVVAALRWARNKIERVVCTASLPGGEGRALATRLRRDGFEASVVSDSEIARALSECTVALVGADAITPDAAVNKVGTALVALAAREAGVPCYALAGSSKFLPRAFSSGGLYEPTPLRLLAAVVTERGALSASAVRRAAARIEIPRALVSLVP